MKKYALISVYDKTGIVEFAKILVSLGYNIISTGGTAKTLLESGIKVIPIQEITGNPESFDGRMKTISFQVESGILFDRDNPMHVRQAKKLGVKPIDLVVCNFYPFEEKPSIENIDIGGPTMVRTAAKNFKHVLVIIDPSDYQKVSKTLIDGTFDKLRETLAAKAFWSLSYYDCQVAKYLNKDLFSEKITLVGKKVVDLRYGENPHQKAALYLEPKGKSLFNKIQKLWGRNLSLINVTDINAGIESVRLFREPCAVVIKHNTPCGIALGKNISQALKKAIEADSESAFGGVIVLNKTMDYSSAKVISSFKTFKKGNIDIVAVPKIQKNALKFLTGLRKSMGIYTFGQIPTSDNEKYNIKWVNGGFVLQTPDKDIEKSFKEWKTVTKTKASAKQITQMKIAWKFITRIRSNAVIIVDKNLPMTRGIGSGQTSRVRSTKIAITQAGNFAKGAILASDSFFPFDDSVILAKKYGIGAIIQQGGSINDQLVIEAAEKAGIPMVFTHHRAFWH